MVIKVKVEEESARARYSTHPRGFRNHEAVTRHGGFVEQQLVKVTIKDKTGTDNDFLATLTKSMRFVDSLPHHHLQKTTVKC